MTNIKTPMAMMTKRKQTEKSIATPLSRKKSILIKIGAEETIQSITPTIFETKYVCSKAVFLPKTN